MLSLVAVVPSSPQFNVIVGQDKTSCGLTVPAGWVVGSDTQGAAASLQCCVSCVGTTDRTGCLLQFQPWGVGSKCVLFVSEGFKRLERFVERAVSRVAKRKSGARKEMYSAGILGACR